MTIKTTRIHNAWSLKDIFGDGMWCPYCLGELFMHLEGHSITCDRCDAEFSLRMTAGDPGVVVDAFSAETKFMTVHQTFWVKPRRARTRDNTSCAMVLKECEAGLDDRDRWYTPFKTNHANYLYRDDNEPLGREVFHFSAREIARHLAHERWLEKTKAGQQAQALNTSTWNWPRDLRNHHHKYMHQWRGKIADELGAKHQEGYYWRDQTQRILDTAYWIALAIPQEDQSPISTNLGWPKA